jgi:ABC-type polysaccharide/polyol phosphate export permease
LNNTVVKELKAILAQWPIWFMLGTQDIKLRYRRSSIGPLWITISMAVTIYSMGFLYSHLFKVDLKTYFPYLASGIIAWSFISTLITEGSNIFIDSESYIRNQAIAMSLFMMRLVLRNVIIFFHNLLAFLPILFIFPAGFSWKLLLLIPGLLVIGLNAIFWGTLLAIFGTRYRDFSQIITSIIQVIFFLTPIMWLPNSLPARFQWVTQYNPFNQFLNVIRAPLIDQNITTPTVLMVTSVSILGFLLYALFIKKYKQRIVFWL